MAWFMLAVLIVSVAVWYITRDTLPEPILIATGARNGMYYKLGDRLAVEVGRDTGHTATVVETHGSRTNAQLLRDGSVQAAIVQAGSVSLADLAVVSPVNRDVVHVVVRDRVLKGSDGQEPIRTLRDLRASESSAGSTLRRRVAVGELDSGMRASAEDLLRHYGILDEVELCQVYFGQLLEDPTLDAAIVTTGHGNNDLRAVMASGEFGLLGVDGPALDRLHRHFTAYEMPAGLWPPLPHEPVETVATTALLVVREDAPKRLVEALLDAMNDHDLQQDLPGLAPEELPALLSREQMHPAARAYHAPLGSFTRLSELVQPLAAGKELLVALGAALYLAWDRWRRLRERERQEQTRAAKTQLNHFLEQTLRLERAQLRETNLDRLQSMLDEVTEIKLTAMRELKHEYLHEDGSFAVFMSQCADLISKIQLRILVFTSRIR